MSKVRSEEACSAAHLEQLQQQLLAAIKAERAKARANHWSYDHNRHSALLKAYKEAKEREAEARAQLQQQDAL